MGAALAGAAVRDLNENDEARLRLSVKAAGPQAAAGRSSASSVTYGTDPCGARRLRLAHGPSPARCPGGEWR